MTRIGHATHHPATHAARPSVAGARSVSHPTQRPRREVDAFEPTGFRRFGVDTNAGDMDPALAKRNGAKFVARYLSDDGNPSDPALTPAEAKKWSQAGVPLVAVWETGRQDHVLAGNSLAAAKANGAADARKARTAIDAAGGKGQPIYFTVDFNVGQKGWNKPVTDPTTGKATTQGALIRAYFAGIRSVLPKDQVGVYGTNTVLKHLFDNKTVAFGWQQAVGRKGKHVDARAQLEQTRYAGGAAQAKWGVGQAGGLDKDRAIKKSFGQWFSTLGQSNG